MIIGICGLAGAGKDTFADGIIKYDNSYTKLKMATFLKDITSILFCWNRAWLDGETVESRKWREQVDEFWNDKVIPQLQPFTPRKALQYIGTDLGRTLISTNLWVYQIEKYILENKLNNVLIPDLRFPEEIDMVKRLGGSVVEVRRHTPDWFYDILDYRINKDSSISTDYYNEILKTQHQSETAWIGNINIDYVIHNNQTIKDLEKKAITFLNLGK